MNLFDEGYRSQSIIDTIEETGLDQISLVWLKNAIIALCIDAEEEAKDYWQDRALDDVAEERKRCIDAINQHCHGCDTMYGCGAARVIKGEEAPA